MLAAYNRDWSSFAHQLADTLEEKGYAIVTGMGPDQIFDAVKAKEERDPLIDPSLPEIIFLKPAS